MRQKRTLRAERLSKIAIGAGIWTAVNAALSIVLLGALFVGPVAGEEDQGRDYWYEKSLELYNNGSLEDSLQAVDNAIGIDSKNATLWAHKASCLNMAGVISQNQSRFNESLRAYDKTIEIAPGNTTYLLWKGYAFRQAAYGSGLQLEDRTRALEEGLKVFDLALNINPKYGEAWTGKGVIFDDLATFNDDSARYFDSLAAYDRAIELTAKNDSQNLAQAYEGKAVALSHFGQHLSAIGQRTESKSRLEEAVENYDKVIEMDKDFVGQEAQQNRAGILKELSDVRAWTAKGHALRSLGRNKEAIQAYDSALRLDPDLAAGWSGKGAALRDLGRYNESVQAYEKAIQIDPELARAWIAKGDVLLSLKRCNESMNCYENATDILSRNLAKDPNDSDAWWLKAESLDDLGRSEAALEAYDKVIDLNTTNALGALIRKSDIFITLGRYNESAETFDEAIDLLPTKDKQSVMTMWWDRGTIICYNAWMADGQIIRVSSGWLNKSSGHIENILLISSDLVAAWQNPKRLNANWAQYGFPKTNMPCASIAENQSMLLMDASAEDNAASNWLRKAYELSANGSHEAALLAYDKVLETDPNNYTVLINKGHDLKFWSVENYNKALEITNHILEKNPNDALAWQGKGAALSGLGSTEDDQAYAKAIEVLDRYTEENPENASAWFLMGENYANMHRAEEALAAYEKVIELNYTPDYEAALATKAILLAKLKRFDEALDAAEKALLLNSKSASAWTTKAYILKMLGHKGEADDAFAKAR